MRLSSIGGLTTSSLMASSNVDSLIQHRQIIVEFYISCIILEFYNNLPILDEAVYVG